MPQSTSDTMALPTLFRNRLLNRLALFCFAGLIQRIGEHYRRWCESLEQHSQALEQGTRVSLDRYRRELIELRHSCGALDSALRHSQAREQQESEMSLRLGERLQVLEAERERERERLADLLEESTRLQQRLRETESERDTLRRQLAERQTHDQLRDQTLTEQAGKLRELLTLIDTFRQERAEAVRQRDQQEQHWRTELAATRRSLQQRELELDGLRRFLERQEKLLQQRKAEPTPAPLTIPVPVMRRLLQLCHPDKHNGSETALEATRWLTALRQQHRQRVH